ncbi:putative quinol monooxygenase [Allosalinactinospora lopnorensis]|uniref:putative quinol monooxygenase n=1 Tax=Allosalinactinospora lopnorensis TaxID=1352348 RepID=UPI000623FFD2|nr:antibiotic biosynthesis monooxygenase [Allosalinactinospora lopnorensis]
MVEVGLAFVCALVAWSATAALIAHYSRDPQPSMLVWVVSGVSVAVALSAAFPGALLDFSGITFRVFQIGIGLLGPLLAAWGAVEYTVTSARLRFGARLVVATLTTVPLVILSVDRLRGQFESSYPAMADHYDVIPKSVLGLVHILVLLVILGCVIAVLRRRREHTRLSGHQAAVLGLIGLAALLEILVSRLGMGVLGQLVITGAVVSLWTGCLKAQQPPQSGRGRRGGRRRSDFDDEVDDEFDDEPSEAEEDDVSRKRRAASGFDGYGGESAPQGRSSRLRGIITIYTLVEGYQDTFDELVEEIVEEVTRREPDTLLFACHTVPSAPLQRIIYAIYRDQLAYEEHEQQPHIMEFARETQGYVVATNVIGLVLSGASVTDNLSSMLMPR